MTSEEFREAQLAEQRHTYLDADPDSRFGCTDTRLCHHGRPLLDNRCPDCIKAREGWHRDDMVQIGLVYWCRECGLSWGVHKGSTG